MLHNDNYKKIVRKIIRHGAASQVEISEAMELSQAAICNMVKDLRDAGLIKDSKKKAANGSAGRRQVLLGIDESRYCLIAVWEQAGRLVINVMNLKRKVLLEKEYNYSHLSSQAEILSFLIEKINEIRPEIVAFKNNREVLGVGVALGGNYEENDYTDSISTSDSEGEEDRFFSSRLASALGVPVAVGDRNVAAAMAERWFGSARNHENFVYVQALPFLRAVVFFHDMLYMGASSFAGQIGAALGANGSGPTYNCDLLDNGVFGIPSLKEKLAEKGDNYGTWLGRQLDGIKIVEAQMREFSLDKDGNACEKLKLVAKHVGRIMVNIGMFYDPSTIILGGLDMKLMPAFIREIVTEMDKWLLYRKAEDYNIVPAMLGSECVKLAPMCLLLEKLLGPAPVKKTNKESLGISV